MTSALPHWYRYAAPMPNTVIGHRKFFPPDEGEAPDLSGGWGTLRPIDAEGALGSIYMGSGEAE